MLSIILEHCGYSNDIAKSTERHSSTNSFHIISDSNVLVCAFTWKHSKSSNSPHPREFQTQAKKNVRCKALKCVVPTLYEAQSLWSPTTHQTRIGWHQPCFHPGSCCSWRWRSRQAASNVIKSSQGKIPTFLTTPNVSHNATSHEQKKTCLFLVGWHPTE